MPSTLIPGVEQRVSSLLEVSRRVQGEVKSSRPKQKIAITISREFGCEAYPMAEKLKDLLEKKCGEAWALMDKSLLEEVAKNHNLSEEILHNLGEKPRFIDDVISTFSSNWKTDKDYYRLLCRHIMSLATGGNVIIVGRGGAVITQSLENCYHFRLIAPMDFKVRSIAKRLGLSPIEAQDTVQKKQQQRDKFVKDFLNRDTGDPTLYHLVFNNGKNSPEKMAETIAQYIF